MYISLYLLWILLLWTLVYKYLLDFLLAFNSFGYIPRRGIASSYICFTFWETAKLYSTAAAVILHSYQPCTRVSISPQPQEHFTSPCCFYNSHPNGCEVVFHCGFDLLSLMTNDVEDLFLCLFTLEYLLWRNVSFYCWVIGFYIFWGLIPYQIYDLQILPPVLWVFIKECPLMYKSLNFW